MQRLSLPDQHEEIFQQVLDHLLHQHLIDVWTIDTPGNHLAKIS